MIITFKRLAQWPRPPHQKRRALSGSAKFDVTRNDFVARLLELRTTEVWVGLDFDGSDMREDGWPRANAIPPSPVVLLVVVCRYGRLLFACDTYLNWLDNLHALVLVMDNLHQASAHEAVPAQELYRPFIWAGMAQWLAGEPFSGDLSSVRVMPAGKGKWTATTRMAGEWAHARPSEPPPPKTPPPRNPPPPPPKTPPSGTESFSTRAKAAAWLAEKTGTRATSLLGDERAFLEAYRLAARTMHPDVGGEPGQFRRLQNAKIIIERGASWTK